jgi:hypothetical protein
MLEYLLRRQSERKARLFACACCRRVWGRLPDPRSRDAIEVVERFADGSAGLEELKAAQQAAEAAHRDAGQARRWRNGEHAVGLATFLDRSELEALGPRYTAALWASHAAGDGACLDHVKGPPNRTQRKRRWLSATMRETAAQCSLLRDIFGNPFRQPAVAPAWLAWNNGTVMRLAQAIYNERHLPQGTLDTARLAILADALQEAGCADAAILDHCRQLAEHVRGCWVVDLLLGKA